MLEGGSIGYTNFVGNLQTYIGDLLEHYCFDGYHALSSALNAPLAAIATLYIAIVGISVAFGWAKLSMATVLSSALKIGLIYTAVTDWGFVAKYGYNFINSATDHLSDSLLGAMSSKFNHIQDGFNSGLQSVLTEFTNLGTLVFSQGHWDSIGPYLAGIVIWGFGYAMVGLGLFEIVLSEIMIAVLFVVLPVIAAFCFFKSLQGIFDRWLGLVIGAALLQLLVKAILALSIQLSFWWIGGEAVNKATGIGEAGTLPVALVGIICIGLICKASTLAYTIGGGYFTFSGSAMFGRTVGGLFGGVVSTFGTAMGGIATAAKAGNHGAHGVMSVSKRMSEGYRYAREKVSNLQHSARRGDE